MRLDSKICVFASLNFVDVANFAATCEVIAELSLMVPRTAVGAARGRYALARWVGAPPPSFEQLRWSRLLQILQLLSLLLLQILSIWFTMSALSITDS